MNNLKPLMGIAIAILFILVGASLINKPDIFRVIIGYACIVFFSGVIGLAVIKLLSKKNK